MIDNSVSDSESSYDFAQHIAAESVDSFRLNSPEKGEESMSYVQPPISNLKHTFDQLDKEGRGFIRKSALRDTLMLTSEQYDRHIITKQIEECGDQINYQKFEDIFRCANKGESINQWLFELYDKDQKGYIGAEDLRRAAQITEIDLSEQQIASMLETKRNCGNGKVDYQDFRYFMEKELQYM